VAPIGAELGTSDATAAPAPAASTPPGTPWDPTPAQPRGPINAAAGVIWQNGRTTEEMRRRWAAGARVAMVKRCGLCTAPLYLSRGEWTCFGCRSDLPIRWRRRVTELWLTGMQASDIAKIVGGTKSAVLSYRRRALLPGRGSPLRGCTDSERAQRKARAIANRDQIKPPAAPKPPPVKRVAKVQGSPTCKPGGPSRAARIAAENAITRRPEGPLPKHAPRHGFTTCQYITGRATYCDDPVAELSPYCAEHTRLCFAARAA
jgi:hypothetical protein